MNVWELHVVFAIGGGLGAIARHALTKLVTHRFPLSTLLVNVVGSLLLGVGTGFLMNSASPVSYEGQRLLFGFCGGFTTFSSFAYQSLDLHREETIVHASINILASLLLCLVAYVIGLRIS